MKYLVSLLTLLITTISISWAQIPASEIKVVAHRGANRWAPENTIAAFLKAAEMGADYAEMDVRQTKDGIFIIMHDADVKRTTNGSGKVSDMTLEEIKKLDAGSWFAEEFTGEKVPTLREVLQAIDGKILPDLDFKAGDPEQLIALLEEENYLNRGAVTLYTGNWELAKQVKELSEGKIMVRPSPKGDLEYLLQYLDPPIVNLSMRAFSPKVSREIQKRGSQSFVNCLFMADKEKNIRKAIKAGVNFIQTDSLDILIELLKEFEKKEQKKDTKD